MPRSSRNRRNRRSNRKSGRTVKIASIAALPVIAGLAGYYGLDHITNIEKPDAVGCYDRPDQYRAGVWIDFSVPREFSDAQFPRSEDCPRSGL